MRVHRHHSAELRFELAFAPPAPALTRVVRQYAGWIDWSTVQRGLREVPSGDMPLVILFQGKTDRRDIFTSGLHDSATIVKSDGPTAGVQADLTAVGARLFFNQPLSDFTNRTLSLDDVIGATARRLQAELHDAPTWEARFAILDRVIASRVAASRSPSRELMWSWEALTRTAGRMKISALVDEIGWSERHFASEFRRQLGMTPKAFARVLRFARVVRQLTTRSQPRLVDIALDCGYYDQAHFARDFRTFAGITPTELLASRNPDGSGFLPEPHIVPNTQPRGR
jgi:AraC-like DNA-binding protein